MEFSALTYNIRHGRGTDDKVDIKRIADVIAKSGADIICLQEVDRSLPRSGFTSQAEFLAAELGYSYAFHANFGLMKSGMGNAILCRFPINSTWNTSLPYIGEPRGLLYAQCTITNTPLSVFCTHWGLTPGQRRNQSKASLHHIVKTSGPTIFAGDLNAVRSAVEVDTLISGGKLIDHGPETEYTFTSKFPVVKIDYILSSQELTTQSAIVIPSDASDHCPIAVRFELPV
jgi:endonuclease/exonuclease/phosphatase family metal-dependent hydrolase